MSVSNSDVKRAFGERRGLNSNNLVSTGESLLSYGWWEIARWVDGVIVTRKGSSYSVTTAGKHRTYVHGVEAITDTPRGQGEMNL